MRHSSKVLQAILLFGMLLILTGCQEHHNQTTYLGGRLPDYAQDTIRLISLDDQHPGLLTDRRVQQTTVGEDGSYLFEVPALSSGYYQVVKSNYPLLTYDLYLENGDSVMISKSGWGEIPVYELSGRGTEKHQHLKADFENYYQGPQFIKYIKSRQFETAMDFKAAMDSMADGRIALTRQQDIPEKMKERFMTDIKAESARLQLAHLKRRNYTMDRDFSYHIPPPAYSEPIVALSEQLDYNTTESRRMLKPFLDLIIRLQPGNNVAQSYANLKPKLQYIQSIAKGSKRDQLSQAVITDFSMAMFEDNFFEDIASFKQAADTSFVSEDGRYLFEYNYESYLDLAPGELAPDFKLVNLEGNELRLSDFIGRVVYIDFWGTWCMPCIEEIPNAVQLQEEFEGEEVAFVYIALEAGPDQKQVWKDFIAGKDERFEQFLPDGHFPGIHLYADQQFSNPQLSGYKLNFAPTHVLIDQQGRIVNARAERSKNIGPAIRALLDRQISLN